MDLINKILRFKVHLLGLSTDDKPLDVVNGSTFLEVDTSKFYIIYGGTWYEQNKTEDDTPDDPVTPDDPDTPDDPIDPETPDDPPAENNNR